MLSGDGARIPAAWQVEWSGRFLPPAGGPLCFVSPPPIIRVPPPVPTASWKRASDLAPAAIRPLGEVRRIEEPTDPPVPHL